MNYLIWSILNISVALCFLYLIVGFLIKGKKIFKPGFKVISICFLLFGIVQVLLVTASETHVNRITIEGVFNKEGIIQQKNTHLEENLTFDINLNVTYSKHQNECILIESTSSLTGFISGYDWELKSIQTTTNTTHNACEFSVEGILKWQLFGITIYNEIKTFQVKMEGVKS